MKLRPFYRRDSDMANPNTRMVHHYSQVGPIRDEILEARLAGYETAARQFREGKQIAKPLGTLSRVVFMTVVFASFAAVALVASWIL